MANAQEINHPSKQLRPPSWRGKAPGTAYFGPDRFWRLRDTLVFHLHDSAGSGFGLQVDLRDMNTYCQGPREVLVAVFAPDGTCLIREVVPDDGEERGDPASQDALPDMHMDLRYRGFHYHNSPGRRPPGKSRTPYLADPGRIPSRPLRVRVPPAGAGLYRLMIVGCFDHWVSVTPDRPLAAGVHPGPAPLCIHGSVFQEAYLYAPRDVQDLGWSITEEVQPWSWGLVVEDEAGREVARIAPRTSFNYCVLGNARPEAVYRLRIAGEQPGACLHLRGAPMLLCPDPETARLLHGGVEFDARNRATFHEHQRVLLRWADGLGREDLAVPPGPGRPELELDEEGWRGFTLGDVARALDLQDLDPESPGYGSFRTAGDEAFQERFGRWNPPVNLLAAAAGWEHPDNPYYGHPGLVRRVALNRALFDLLSQSPYFWYDGGDRPQKIEVAADSLAGVPLRSNWYPLQDAWHVTTLKYIRRFVGYALPDHVYRAWRQGLLSWTVNRSVMQQGECANQWGKGLEHMANMWSATREWEMREVLDAQVGRLLTPGSLGRINPDPDPFMHKSSVGYGAAADSGRIGGGIMSDGLGHDAEYNLETTQHLAAVWEETRDPRIVEWANEYYFLKTHLTLPRGGAWPVDTFRETVSPTDSNHRTRFYTHKTPLATMRPHVRYGDIWAGARNEQTPWPCFEQEPFVRSVDNRFFFVKTSGYYGIVYAGPTTPSWFHWFKARVSDGSVDMHGYNALGYGAFGRKASKPGGISAIWVPNCGPTLLCQNHNVWYSNTVWGRRRDPVCPGWASDHIDPTVICSAYSTPEFCFDPEKRSCVRVEEVEYAPLRVTRRIAFGDDCVRVELAVEALDDLDLVELYECIPYFAEQRAYRVFGQDLAAGRDFAPPQELGCAEVAKTFMPGNSGISADAPRVALRAFDVSAPGGAAGTTVILDREYDCLLTSPLRYRALAAPTAAFSLPLPHDLRKGQSHSLRYALYSHQQPVTPEKLRELQLR